MLRVMNARTIATLVAGTLAVSGVAATVQLTNNPEPLAKRMGSTPVVVELFTSQGCSSCPPADAMLAAITHDESLKGRVIPLAFHVDYWDRQGWRDPFSSSAWTQRQMTYVKQMKLSTAFTPQMVVGGQRQFTGSRPDMLDQSLVEASQRAPVGQISIDAKREEKDVVANVTATGGEKSDLVVALIEYGITTNVGGGENKGRAIVNEAIVRELRRAKPGRTTFKVDPDWKNLAVVAFFQDRGTMAITNAAISPL